jgi:hypothetical protein
MLFAALNQHHSQAEESEEEEEEKSEATYDYLSPFLPPLIGMQQLTREEALQVGSKGELDTHCVLAWPLLGDGLLLILAVAGSGKTKSLASMAAFSEGKSF